MQCLRGQRCSRQAVRYDQNPHAQLHRSPASRWRPRHAHSRLPCPWVCGTRCDFFLRGFIVVCLLRILAKYFLAATKPVVDVFVICPGPMVPGEIGILVADDETGLTRMAKPLPAQWACALRGKLGPLPCFAPCPQWQIGPSTYLPPTRPCTGTSRVRFGWLPSCQRLHRGSGETRARRGPTALWRTAKRAHCVSTATRSSRWTTGAAAEAW